MAAASATGCVVNPLPNTSNSCLLGASSVGSTSEFLPWSVHEGSSKLSSHPLLLAPIVDGDFWIVEKSTAKQ